MRFTKLYRKYKAPIQESDGCTGVGFHRNIAVQQWNSQYIGQYSI